MTQQPIAPGSRIEDYLIEKSIGKGGMAELFLARDLGLNRHVVIKVLSPLVHRKKDLSQQFIREARIQANLDNPHIVQIFRVFTHEETLCIAMQRVRGTDLERVIRRAKAWKERRGQKGALSVQRSLHIFLQILEGIGFAHRYRIVHGDIKPANILLDRQGRVKVADFGLSVSLSRDREYKGETAQWGTPYFMAPELVLEGKMDFRSDVYALGITLFNMLTGRLPFEGRKLLELVESHMDGSQGEAQAILAEHEEINPRIQEALLRAMKNDPDGRYQSCLEFSLALRQEVQDETYSELLRLSLLTKKEVSPEERNYLDRAAEAKGLSREEAEILEAGIRKEMGLHPLDFEGEYERSLSYGLGRGKKRKGLPLSELNRIYVRKGRVSKARAGQIREKIRDDRRPRTADRR
ncbi:MAG: serine/threonine protein kinase [Deltaproteobacteria bacterium]|nr:serine/threonine protein kinase [Deltaproteobacteria bacterium]